MKHAIEGLKLEIVQALVAGEAAQRRTVFHPYLHHVPGALRAVGISRTSCDCLRSDPRRRGIVQHLLDSAERQLPPRIRKIRAVRSTGASHHVTRRALPASEENPFAG